MKWLELGSETIFVNVVALLVVELVGLIFVFSRHWPKGQLGQRAIYLFSLATLASGDGQDAYRANLRLRAAATLPRLQKKQGEATPIVPGLATAQ
jgi:hypothetical protein